MMAHDSWDSTNMCFEIFEIRPKFLLKLLLYKKYICKLPRLMNGIPVDFAQITLHFYISNEIVLCIEFFWQT